MTEGLYQAVGEKNTISWVQQFGGQQLIIINRVWCIVINLQKRVTFFKRLPSCNSSRQYFAKINCSICSYPFNQWIFRHWRNLIKSIFEDRGTRSTCRRSPSCPRHCTTALWRQSERTQINTPNQQPKTNTYTYTYITHHEQIILHTHNEEVVCASWKLSHTNPT